MITSSISKTELLKNIQTSKKQDKQTLRTELAYLYHIMDFNGWGDLIVTHASVRIPGSEHFLMAPYGLMFCEVTPDNLVEVDGDGNILNSSEWRVNHNGSSSHRNIYKARKDINCIIHTHSLDGVTFANLNTQLNSLDQMSMMLYGKVGYHDYGSFFTHQVEEKDQAFINSLGNNQCMILRNHGLISLGKNIPEAFWYYYYLEFACKVQLQALATGQPMSHVDARLKEEVSNQFYQWNDQEADGFPGHADLAFAAAKRKLYLKSYYKN